MPETLIKPSTKLIMGNYAVAILLSAAIAGYVASGKDPFFYALLIVPAALAIATLKEHLKIAFTKITIGDGKLRFQEGILSRATRTIELSKLQDVRVTQTLLQRITGTGDLILETAAESGRLLVQSIDDPQSVADRILNIHPQE